MKKLLLIMLALCFITGCTGHGLSLIYKTPVERSFNSGPVYLKVVDVRVDKMLVTDQVKRKDIFKDVGDKLDLKSEAADGTVTGIKGVPVEDAFYEAFRMRLSKLNIGILPDFDPQRFGLTIEVEKIQLDVGDTRTLKAEVTYQAKFYDGEKMFWSQRITGTTQQFYVFGKSGGEEALSEAMTSAINRLDLTKFKLEY